MPNKHEIIKEINDIPLAHDTVRKKYLKKLHEKTGRDTIVYASNYLTWGPNLPPELISISPKDITQFMTALQGLSGNSLDIIIHSPGGSLEGAEQIVNYLRSKYQNIRAIIPCNAMSAATMVACACDEILMAKHSAIGPIDPQIAITSEDGTVHVTPIQSIIDEFEQAKNEIKIDPRVTTLWIEKVKNYPNLKFCQDTINLAKTTVAKWLDSYMFKDSTQKKGGEIADWLGTACNHGTHGRPINFEQAQNKGLKILLIEDDQKTQDIILSLFHAIMATFDNSNCAKIVENHNGKGAYLTLQQRV